MHNSILAECHTGSVKVFTWEGVSFYAGGSSRGLEVYHNSLLINLKEAVNYTFLTTNSPILQDICNKHNDVHVINIRCEDYSVPDLGVLFWKELVDIIKKLPSMGICNVTICCVGGHGRTGTALTILWGLTGGKDDKRPLKTMREKYCSEIVESDKQINYIKEILSIDFEDKKRDVISFYGGKGEDKAWKPGDVWNSLTRQWETPKSDKKKEVWNTKLQRWEDEDEKYWRGKYYGLESDYDGLL